MRKGKSRMQSRRDILRTGAKNQKRKARHKASVRDLKYDHRKYDGFEGAGGQT